MGAQLLEAARAGEVKLGEAYWSTRLIYRDGKYIAQHFKQGFGGMKCVRENRFLARDVSACESIEALAAVIEVTNDCAEGDPSNYSPRDVRKVDFVWTP